MAEQVAKNRSFSVTDTRILMFLTGRIRSDKVKQCSWLRQPGRLAARWALSAARWWTRCVLDFEKLIPW
jgi:hypothetical protein